MSKLKNVGGVALMIVSVVLVICCLFYLHQAEIGPWGGIAFLVKWLVLLVLCAIPFIGGIILWISE
jgi:hypothetical protein